MPNISSHAHHQPQRSCVVCKKKIDQNRLLNFFIMDCGIVFDTQRQLPGRKFYLCPAVSCFLALDKWRKRYQKRICKKL
ncbi:MAG TPA: DUF448 domain-containing protein [Candidatus Cloacimonas sp.]|nr:DUF448 domain-containing protein [Candidatus Cloacimonas sp.]